jgi:hypothetical protein
MALAATATTGGGGAVVSAGSINRRGPNAVDKGLTTFTVRILENHRQPLSRKLADAEIHFVGGELDGLTLVGFALWVDSAGTGENVTFSSRQFNMSGHSRTFSLRRWIAKREAQERMADVVVRAYRRHRRRTIDSGLR